MKFLSITGTAYVYIYKGDLLVNLIPGNAQGQDQVTLSRGYQFDKGKAYTAQVVLNPGTGSEIRSEKIKIEFVNLYIEERDPEFPFSKLKPFDYYPSLGSKRIIVKGVGENGEPFTQGSVRARVIVPSTVNLATITPQTEVPFTDQGEAVFNLNAPTITPAEYEKVEIEFTYVKDNEDQGSIRGEWRVRNNSNVTMKEVWAGEAVFVFDDNPGNSHKGVTPGNVIDDGERYFDFVQELLNQVVPRKRSVIGYTLLNEDGVFSDDANNNTLQAVSLFKQHFNMGGIKPGGIRIGNTIAAFSVSGDQVNYEGTDDTTDIFRKLTKDYDKRTNTATASQYLHRIIDQGILVGSQEKTVDNLINGIPGNFVNDTGLYELYDNVVKKFIAKMIEEADRFRNYQNRTWYSRNNIKQGPGVDHGNGVSYCFGCKDTVEFFEEFVSGCTVPQTALIPGNYRGNLNNNTCAVQAGQIYQYPGLWENELNANSKTQPFWPTYWSGVDCSGIVQRMWMTANVAYQNTLQLDSGVTNLVLDHATEVQNSEIGHHNFFVNNLVLNIPLPPANSAANIAERNRLLLKLKKGDLMHYNTHISTVYSQRWGESRYRQTIGLMYDIIHAYGGGAMQTYNEGIMGKPPLFARKVMITGSNISTPIGFGRIKLWQ